MPDDAGVWVRCSRPEGVRICPRAGASRVPTPHTPDTTVAKLVHDAVLDAAFNVIRDTCTSMTLCSAQPTTFAEGNATFALADVAMAPGDFTIENGAVSGRRIVVAAKAGVPVDATGTSNHVALLDTTGSRLLFVTTHTGQALTSGNTADIGSWSDELADPT
jgi:hypothetical protein